MQFPNTFPQRDWNMKHLLSTLGALVISAFVHSAVNRLTIGPYDLIDVNMVRCEDEGTQDFSYTLKTRKISRTAFSFAMNLTLKNYDMGDDLDALVTASVFTNGGWKQNYFNKRMPNLCKTVLLFSPFLFDTFMGRMNNGVCPIPQGTYTLNETSLEAFRMSFSTAFYQKFRVYMNAMVGNVNIGCLGIQMTVIPKKKKQG